jgi:cyclase|tara:strand:+ start:138 stop:902 length:765 start_codon:yes stop_codon:yes gene_type:complete
MNNFRVIPRMDIKNHSLIKTIRLEGVRPIGNPIIYAKKYYEDGADEIFLNDTVASLYDRNSLADVIKEIAKEVFVPITVAGGIRSTSDVEKLLKSGADKVALNTKLHEKPDLINEISKNFGSQCMVLQIDAKKMKDGSWEPYIRGGRDRTFKNMIDWAKEAEDRGSGEIYLTSVDNEGTRKGLDLDLHNNLKKNVNIPVIYSGGVGEVSDIIEAYNEYRFDGISLSYLLHIKNKTISEIKKELLINNIKLSERK